RSGRRSISGWGSGAGNGGSSVGFCLATAFVTSRAHHYAPCMQVIGNAAELEHAVRSLGRRAGLGGVLVPPMGALHEGHAALVRRGAELAGPNGVCAVAICVNPPQGSQ